MSANGIRDDYDNWFFTTEKSNHQCPNVRARCAAPKACSRDPRTGQSYCCDTGLKTVCWGVPSSCEKPGTFKCTLGTTSWCCLSNTEKCSQNSGQTSICWSTGQNTLKQINVTDLESAFSSLSSSAQPSASYLSFVPSSIIAATRSGSSTNGAATVTATSAGDPAAATSASGGSSGTLSPAPGGGTGKYLGAGAIAGLVVGLVVGLAAVALGGLLLWRCIKTRSAAKNDGVGVGSGGTQPAAGELDGASPQQSYYGYQQIAATHGDPPIEAAEVGNAQQGKQGLQHAVGAGCVSRKGGSGSPGFVGELPGDCPMSVRQGEKTLSKRLL